MSQLDLFAQPARRYGMPPSVVAQAERARTTEVRLAYLAVVSARPGEWLDCRAFRDVRERYNLTSRWSDPLGYLVRDGLIEERNVYAGSERPGPDYKGFHNEWRYVAPARPQETP